MKDKAQKTRDYIINLLEKGKLKAEDKVPAAREIAEKLNISFLIVQNAISSLVKDNILQSVPRQGTFVRKNWQMQAINYNICTIYSRYDWFNIFKKKVEAIAPELRVTSAFTRGLVEIKPSLISQINQHEYMDLTDIFNEACPEKSNFYMEATVSFSSKGKLLGIPFTFSPRLLFYNKNLLEKAGLKEPETGWKWNDYLDYIRQMKTILPANDVAAWNYGINIWMNVVLRAGGTLIDPSSDDPIKLDSPETKKGIKLWKELHGLLELPDNCLYNDNDFVDNFANNKRAFFIGSRVNLMYLKKLQFNDWGVVRLPVINPEINTCTQATETICVRNECPRDIAVLFVKTMLSKPIQNFMGSLPYGIPFLKSAALKGLNENDPRDKLFFDIIPHTSARYFIGYPEFHEIINAGMNYIWQSNNNVDETTGEIAAALRTLLKIGVVS